MSAPQVCVSAVVRHASDLLLVQRGRGAHAGRWAVPGGRVEPGEQLAHAVVREVMEETGLRVEVERLLGVAERIDADGHFVILCHAARLAEPTDARPEPHAADDAAEARWVPVDAVERHDLVEGLAQFLADSGALDPVDR